MLEFIPFNQELNRYLLVVKNPPAASLKITWGEESKVFTSEQLAAGINLAAEFLKNPFSAPFAKLLNAFAAQQIIDRQLIGPTSLMDEVAGNRQKNPDAGGNAFEDAKDAIIQFDSIVRANSLRQVVPVNHTILIEPVGKP